MIAPGHDSISLADARARYFEQRHIFNQIRAAATSADMAISGIRAPSDNVYLGAVLFTKALAHAISLDKIFPQPDADRQLYDLSSGAILTRAIAETYLAFRYYAMDPGTDDDARFRLALAQFHRRYKQHKIMKRFGIGDNRLVHAQLKLDEARGVLESNDLFRAQQDGDKRKQLKGERSSCRALEDVAEAAGIHRHLWGAFYPFVSQFAHSSPLAAIHLANFRADHPDATSNLSMMLELTSGFLSKFIVDLELLFPGCGANISPEQRLQIQVETGVIENMTRDVVPEPS